MIPIHTAVVHSQSVSAWNVVGTELGKKFKIARVPYYIMTDNPEYSARQKEEAYTHAMYISQCFNKYEELKGVVKI